MREVAQVEGLGRVRKEVIDGPVTSVKMTWITVCCTKSTKILDRIVTQTRQKVPGRGPHMVLSWGYNHLIEDRFKHKTEERIMDLKEQSLWKTQRSVVKGHQRFTDRKHISVDSESRKTLFLSLIPNINGTTTHPKKKVPWIGGEVSYSGFRLLSLGPWSVL